MSDVIKAMVEAMQFAVTCPPRKESAEAMIGAALLAAKNMGWKLVPAEPDIAMTKAAIDADDKRTGAETCKHLYRAMIAASPEVM